MPIIVKSIAPLPAVLTVAFIVRAVIAVAFPNIIGPDEVFQALEQAHRLVFGQGIVPWEFQVGLRNWLIPLTLAAPMALARVIGLSPFAGLILIRLLLCVGSLGIVACAVKWGERFYGRQGAWISGLLAAFWPDLWLMAPHPLEEVLAADLLVPAIYLISTPQTTRRTVAAAMLLGLAFTLRLQLAPAIAIAGISLCQRDVRRWALALTAAAMPVLAAGMLDWFTWGQPFRSFWLNIYLNVLLGVAKDEFGASPSFYFLYMLALGWFWSLPVVLALAWQGGRKLPVAGVVAVVIVLTHTLISHKEYRFIFPAISLAVPLAGIGLAALWRKLATAGLITVPGAVLALVLLAGPLVSPWVYFMLIWQTNSVQAFRTLAAHRPALVSLQGWQSNFRSYLPFDLVFAGATALTRQTITPSLGGRIEADAIVATLPARIPPGFSMLNCYRGTWIPLSKIPNPRICIWLRPGAASAGTAPASMAPASTAPASTAPPFIMPFPKAARPFIIPDRLAP